MPAMSSSGGELFIVDNSDEAWKGLRYLEEWTEISKSFDIATGYFEIGSLLALDGNWQKLDRIRILMGDQATLRTHKALAEALQKKVTTILDQSIEAEKEKNDFLKGTAAIVEALRSKKIECKVLSKKKFHAKAYITHSRLAVVGSAALVGSSNFTLPGLTQNIELNIQIRAPGDVAQLQAWFDKFWEEAEDFTPGILQVIERHVREFTPFEVYAKALRDLFNRHELTASEWEQRQSRLFPVLDQYQRDGYKSLLGIAAHHRGAFLCDGVGLGKTFVGLMLIERLVMFEKKRVVLLVPKSGREPVWERNIRKFLPDILNGFLSFKIFNHTDLMRGESPDGRNFPEELRQMQEQADVVIVDEAHHFRNRGLSPESGGSRYWKLYDLCAGKQVFLLTATPVNNHLTDFQHLIELFSRTDRPDAFAGAPLGIHSLPAHFRLLEKQLAEIMKGATLGDLFESSQVDANQVLFNDRLFRELVVQRSRAFVKQSQKQQGAKEAQFPKKDDPRVVEYSVEKTYGSLLAKVEVAFAKDIPLFALAPYYPLAYLLNPGEENVPDFEKGRQKGLVRLIRVQFLKRFESSITAFEFSCQNLLLKLVAFLRVNCQPKLETARLEKWTKRNEELLAHLQARRSEFVEEDDGDETSDALGGEYLDHFYELPRTTYRVDDIIDDTFDDLETLVDFLEELKRLKTDHDDKLQSLIKVLRNDVALKGRKVLIFSEFMSTARYLKRELIRAGFKGVDEIDSATKRDRAEALQQFAPYYNSIDSAELAKRGLPETSILIATDVLAEGLNLQDATRLINYDIHWNPVRLMQRIGRVDRRLNPEIEKQLVADHPGEKKHRGRVVIYNFLPPDDLEELLKLYSRVSNKTLRISKVFGIEGRKLLTPDEEYDDLRDFLSTYEGTTSPTEKMLLELEKLVADNPALPAHLDALPGRVFSGKAHATAGARGVFFCYLLPGEDRDTKEWTDTAGRAAWFLISVPDGRIMEQPEEIHAFVRCVPDTPRRCALSPELLRDTRLQIEKHITKTYLRKVQAPIGVRPILRCWMELN